MVTEEVVTGDVRALNAGKTLDLKVYSLIFLMSRDYRIPKQDIYEILNDSVDIFREGKSDNNAKKKEIREDFDKRFPGNEVEAYKVYKTIIENYMDNF